MRTPSALYPSLLLAFTLAAPACAGAQTPPARGIVRIDPAELARMMDSVVPAAMAERQIPGAVVTVVQDGRVLLSRGYGYADVERGRRVSPDSTVFQIGSISKVFTATAVVQLADRGRIRLDQDVNRYLRRTRVPDAFAAPVTPWHLLTHSAGFDELPGRLVREDTAHVLPLARFLSADRLVRVHPPGELPSYSSYTAALAGLLVEEVSGMEYERYLACGVWGPLGMSRTQVTVPEWLRADASRAYEVDSGRVVAVPWERYHTPPSSSISSTGADMGRFMTALLQEGRLGDARILTDTAVRAMLSRQATLHPRLPGWGLGIQEADTHGERIWEHGGDVAGFSSLMVLLPDHELGVFVAGHREGSDLRWVVRRALLNRWFPDRRTITVPPPDPAAVARLRRLEGTYRGATYCHTCPPDQQRVDDVVVTVRDDGALMVWDEPWIEVEPLFFRSPDGTRRFGFHEDAAGRITAMTVGSWMVLEKLP
ncbi:MAG TPA: serine hydrolase domain-containing protein [Longimicrobium sp.]|nr:serine hydrolase domain-containing protein [Longimicrobium sp.]